MRDIKLLDCTLRDGGYINDNNFGEENILHIVEGLRSSGIDLVEYGYLKNKNSIDNNRTEFRDFEDLSRIVGQKRGNILMLLGERYNIHELPEAPNDNCFLRVSFHKKNVKIGISKIREVLRRGYKVFIQPTATMSYSDNELIELLRVCNELKPVSVAVVDTFGQMAPSDVAEKAKLFDSFLDKHISMSFHAHNNLQNAYANAIKFVESVAGDRKIIIDTSIYGMGRGAGNLPTELMMSYLNKNYDKKYNIDPLLNVTENVISKYKEKNHWGYSLPYFISGAYGVHPSYVLAFMERKTQNAEDIKHLIDMISNEKKAEFDADYANEIYNTYNNKTIDDQKSKKELSKIIKDRNILLMGPGKTIKEYDRQIKKYIEKDGSFVIGVNGEYGIKTDAVFFSNKKRYDGANLDSECLVMTTSNIGNNNVDFVFNYGEYLAKECGTSDNALLMLLNILKSMGVKKVMMAGFDGYDIKDNFINSSLELLLDKNYIEELNKTIRVNINKLKNYMIINTITPSKNI